MEGWRLRIGIGIGAINGSLPIEQLMVGWMDGEARLG